VLVSVVLSVLLACSTLLIFCVAAIVDVTGCDVVGVAKVVDDVDVVDVVDVVDDVDIIDVVDVVDDVDIVDVDGTHGSGQSETPGHWSIDITTISELVR